MPSLLDILNGIARGAGSTATAQADPATWRDTNRQFTDDLASGRAQLGGFAAPLVQRLAQNQQATQQGQLMGHDFGNNAGDGTILTAGGSPLSPIAALNVLGLGQEGAQQVAEMGAGGGLAGLGALNRIAQHGQVGDNGVDRLFDAALQGGRDDDGNIFEQLHSAYDSAHQQSPVAATLASMVYNPLNLIGPTGEAGAGLRAAEDAPALVRALGTALEGASLGGKAIVAPYEAAFNVLGRGVKGALGFLKDAPDPAELGNLPNDLKAIMGPVPPPPLSSPLAQDLIAAMQGNRPAVAPRMEQPDLRGILGDWVGRRTDPVTGGTPLPGGPSGVGDIVGQLTAPGQSPLLTTLLADHGPVPVADARLTGTLFGPDVPTGPPPATPGIPPLSLRGTLGDWVGRATDSTRAATPLADGPSNIIDLVARLRGLGPDRAAITPAEEALAKLGVAPAGAKTGVDGATVATAPDFPAPFATRAEGLAALSGRDTNTLLSLAYDHPKAIENAQKKYGDVLALRDRAIERIQQSSGRVALLAQRDPDLAARVAALPDAAANVDNVLQRPASLASAPDYTASIVDRASAAQEADRLAGRYVGPDLAPAKPAPGGYIDTAAGGFDNGGFGIALPASQAVGMGLGAAGGGALGFAAPGDDLHDRLNHAAAGALVGGTVGSGLAAIPQVRALGTEALAGQRAALLDAAGNIRTDNLNPVPGKGLKGLSAAIRADNTTGIFTAFRNTADNAAKQAAAGNSPLTYLGDLATQSKEWERIFPLLRAAPDETARRAIMLDSLRGTSIGPLIDQASPEFLDGLIEKMGMDYGLDTATKGAAGVNPIVAAGRGAVSALASPKTLVTGLATPLIGAAEGATLAGRKAMQDGVLKSGDFTGRLTLALQPALDQLAQDAPAVLAKVQATGQDIRPLVAKGLGKITPADIQSPGLKVEWQNLMDQAQQAGGDNAVQRMGDFSTNTFWRQALDIIAPGGVWTLGQLQLLGRVAAEHPVGALGALNVAHAAYQHSLAEGDPAHAGQIGIDDTTPGVGLLARAMNGGAAGKAFINPTYAALPVGPEIFDLGRKLDPRLNPGQQTYDQFKTVAGEAGLGVNPVVDMIAHKAGLSDTAHAAPSRWAPVGQYLDQSLGTPLKANPLASLLGAPNEVPSDLNQQLQFGRYLDPEAIRAGNEMIYEALHVAPGDPQAAPLTAQLMDPHSALYQAALQRAYGGAAAQALAGEVIPGHPGAATGTDLEAQRARLDLIAQGLPGTAAQLRGVSAGNTPGPDRSMAVQAAIDQAKRDNPVLALGDTESPNAVRQLALDQWKRQNLWLSALPTLYNVALAKEQEQLGLVPLGTAAQLQHEYDLIQSGQRVGSPQVAPGIPVR